MHTPRTTLIALLFTAAATLSPLASAQTPAAPALSETLAAATADRSAAGCPPMSFSNLQRRILTEADRSPEALRSFVNRTRMTHMLDLVQTHTWVDQVKQRNADCRTVITAAAP